jgi:hypothetical protein
MTEVHTSTVLPGSTRLWRYLSLDKLIDVLSTNELFFSPLAGFSTSDPFEGYLPSVAFDANASLYRRYVLDLEIAHQKGAEYRETKGYPLTEAEQIMLRSSLEDLRSTLPALLPAIAKATVVNCWHANDDESEAMWRIYADNGKAVAIETTLDSLRDSIKAREVSHVVHIYPVKYLDFFDTSIQPADCVVEGHLVPLLKRLSYQHEREVRAFISKIAPDARIGADPAFWKAEPMRLPIAVDTLVKAIHVSPYATEPFPSSVEAICKAFGLRPDLVRRSRLLSGHEELLRHLAV